MAIGRDLSNYRVSVPDWLLHRWIIVAYLDPNPIAIGDLRGYVEVALDINAVKVLNTSLKAYVEKGVMPPAEIASVVMNIADDLAAKRAPTLRTGDYIALQMYMRKMAK